MCHVSFKKKLKKVATIEEAEAHLTRERLPDAPIFYCSSASIHDGPSDRTLKRWEKELDETPPPKRKARRRRS